MKRRDDGVDVQGKSPSFPLYPADLERELQLLSLAAGGLWTRMLLRMHFSPRRGFLEHVTGVPMNDADIANLVGKTPRDVSKLLAEMERVGTFSRDERGCIYNRRMVRDTDISRKRREAGAGGLAVIDRDEHGRFAGANPPTPADGLPENLHRQNIGQITVPSSSSFSISPKGETQKQEPYVLPPAAEEKPTTNGAPQVTISNGNGSHPHAIHDSNWLKFREDAEHAGMQGSEPDWDEAWRFHWRQLDFRQREAAHHGILDREGTDDPALNSLPQNYFKLKKWQRPIRGPDAFRKKRGRDIEAEMRDL